MTRIAPFALVAFLLLPAAHAAESLGVSEEKLVTTKAKVVDLACELTKSCPAHCGDGKRQLGLLTPEGKLLVAAKSFGQFMGTTADLLPYCAQEIWVDGLTTSQFNSTVMMVQRLKAKEGDAWTDADKGIKNWAAAHHVAPDSPTATDEWFRHDETVAKAVAKRGKLGVPE
jgi:hypothetical protein